MTEADAWALSAILHAALFFGLLGGLFIAIMDYRTLQRRRRRYEKEDSPPSC